MTAYYGAIGSDGTRLVYWGVGTSRKAALKDAAEWLDDDEEFESLEVRQISESAYRRVLGGDVAAERRLLSCSDVARDKGCTRNAVHKACSRGALGPKVRLVGGVWVIPEAAADAWTPRSYVKKSA